METVQEDLMSAELDVLNGQVPRYQEYVANFDFHALARTILSGDLDGAVNAYVECCGRHADDPSRVALFWENKDGERATVTFADLSRRAARFANVLKAQGVQPGDRVAGLLPRIPELLTVILGTWRAGRRLSATVHGLWPQGH